MSKGLTADERDALTILRREDGLNVADAIALGIPASMLVRLGNFDLVTMRGGRYVVSSLGLAELKGLKPKDKR